MAAPTSVATPAAACARCPRRKAVPGGTVDGVRLGWLVPAAAGWIRRGASWLCPACARAEAAEPSAVSA